MLRAGLHIFYFAATRRRASRRIPDTLLARSGKDVSANSEQLN